MNGSNSAAAIKTFAIFFSFIFLFVVAVLLDLQYLYMMAVTLAVLPLASYLLATFAATRFSARREHPETATEGRPLPITLYVESKGGIPQAALRVRDQLPDAFTLAQPENKDRIALDRWDGKTGERSYTVIPQKRGVYTLGPMTIFTSDPLGLFNFDARLALETQVVVHPQPLIASDGTIGGEGRFGRRERDGKTHRGEGTDFHGVREYRSGDSLRRVHWPTTARTGALTVVEFERAYQQAAVVAIDRTRGSERGTGRHTTLEYAIKIAATLVERTLAAGGIVTLITQGLTLKVGAGIDREATRFRIFDALARIQADADTSLADDLHAARLTEGSYIALVSSHGDAAVSAFIAGRLQRGDQAMIYFVEPTSFGPESDRYVGRTPAVAGADFRLIVRADDPWADGGRRLAALIEERK